MFHIGGFIVFCGLLAQITAQDQTQPVTPAVNQVPKGLLASLTGALSNGLVSKDVLNAVKDLPIVDLLRNQSGPLGKLLPLLNLVDLEVTDARLMELGLVPSPDGHSLYATVPLSLVFNFKLPLIGSVLKVDLDLNITAEIRPEKNEAGNFHLVVGDCNHSPGSLKITLFNGKAFGLTQAILNSLTGFFTNVLPALVQSQVCPLINTLLGQMDVTVVHNIANSLIKNSDVVLQI